MTMYKAYEIATTQVRMTLKMLSAILRRLVIVHLLIVVLLFFGSFATVPTAERQIIVKSLSVLVFQSTASAQAKTVLHQQPSIVSFKKLFASSFLIYLLFPLTLIYFRRRARAQFGKRTVRGSRLIKDKDLQKALRKEGPSFKLTDKISIPCSFENEHFFICGAPGTGKTAVFSKVIQYVKGRGCSGIVADNKAGEFVAKFYSPGMDIIYNPFDARSPHWNLFEIFEATGSLETDFATVAAAIIPEEKYQGAKFFTDSARKILAAILKHAYITHNRTMSYLADQLSEANLQKNFATAFAEIGDASLKTFIENKTGQSQGVLSVLLQYTAIFKYMVKRSGQAEFSLLQWAQNSNSSLIFLPNHFAQREILKGIFSLFINSLGTVIMSLRDDVKRRIFFLLDEFGALNPIEAIPELLKLGRSKGVAAYLGVQEKSQLNHLYGEDIADAIINHCNSHILFRANDYKGAEYFSHLLGEAEQQSMESTYSAGAIREAKDGESYHKSNQLKRLVLASEIRSLENLHFYIRLKNFPVAKSDISYRHYPDIVPAFVPNDHFRTDKLTLRAVDSRQHSPSDKPDSEPVIPRIRPKLPHGPTKGRTFSVDDFDL